MTSPRIPAWPRSSPDCFLAARRWRPESRASGPPRPALAVIAARRSHYPPLPLLLAERGERRQRIARLERLRGLVVLVLHEQPDAVATASSSGAYLRNAVGRSVPRILSRASNTSAIVTGHMTAALYRNPSASDQPPSTQARRGGNVDSRNHFLGLGRCQPVAATPSAVAGEMITPPQPWRAWRLICRIATRQVGFADFG